MWTLICYEWCKCENISWYWRLVCCLMFIV